MVQEIMPLAIVFVEIGGEYEYLAAVSSDSLYIVNKGKNRIIETIVEGKDNDAYLCAFDSEDCLLDYILIWKDELSRGINPTTRLNPYYKP